MRKLFLMLTLFCFCPFLWVQDTAATDQTDKLTAEEMAEADYALWYNQLNQHLLTSADNHEMAMGLVALLNGTLRDMHQQPDKNNLNENLNKQIDILNGLIQQDELSAETIELLLGWCFHSEIVSRCDQDSLLDKQLKQTPDNLNVYMKPLQLAIEKKDPVLTDKIIALMGQTKYSHTTRYNSEAFNQTIDAYIENHPIPDSAITAFKNDKAFLAGVSDVINANLDQRIRDYFPASIKMSYVYLYKTTENKPLYEICKSRADMFKNCLSITQVLINDSNSIQHKGLGYVILMAMHESSGKTELFNAVHVKQEKYKDTIQCLSEAARASHFMDSFLDPKYQQINLLPIGEFKKLELMATYVYQKSKLTNPKHRNPADCYISKP